MPSSFRLLKWPNVRLAKLAGLWLLLSFTLHTSCMTDETIRDLRQETRHIFYHGFNSYMTYAFPEDELRPLSCAPLTRDENPANIGINDVLGNYSLTLIDSLSTLAVLASSPPEHATHNKALRDFQDGIAALVEYYGDGSNDTTGAGKRARGFDLDSKVQVFETVIRGVGGLLSAHLFAVGDLPIRGYEASSGSDGATRIQWPSGFVYDGQLLRLAHDLGKRLLPAFNTPTGLPYPRVNLRSGIPFYASSTRNMDAEHGQCEATSSGSPEITETCSAGAGSLVLEFSTLSRLTGDHRFEIAAKNAFWAVWTRRSSVSLIGSGIDAETGQWIAPYTGIGAGIDSFFEYAFKSHVLLSGLEHDPGLELDHADDFLLVWDEAHEGIKRHIYRGASYQHPHYIQVDLHNGAMRAFWIDSLSAYYPGLLTLAGHLDEAIETHLLYAALWTRYSALPERWSATSGGIESGLTWWSGRPEFIESTWYLYRATKDPFYLHVGEMALRDIKRRCWTRCGWAGLQNVESGEQMDRMESFFLGETAKYLFLLFDPSHPLNTMDAPLVFTTEGHPLIIPNRVRPQHAKPRPHVKVDEEVDAALPSPPTCPVAPLPLPLTISATAARHDIFHAASLARLHLKPPPEPQDSPIVQFSADHPSIALADLRSPSNYTYYPWTLPPQLVPHNATSSKMILRTTFDLSFPTLPNTVFNIGALQRVDEGIFLNSMSGLRLGMIRETRSVGDASNGGSAMQELFRIYSVSNIALGRDEKVFMPRALVDAFNPVDPHFTRMRDLQILDLVLDAGPVNKTHGVERRGDGVGVGHPVVGSASAVVSDISDAPGLSPLTHADPSLLSSILHNLHSLLGESAAPSLPRHQTDPRRLLLPASLPTGPGAAPLPEYPEPSLTSSSSDNSAANAHPPAGTASVAATDLPLHRIYVLDSDLCTDRLPPHVPREHHVLVIRRGGCNFSQKLRNIPAFAPAADVLQLVIVVDFDESPAEAAQDDASGQSGDGQWLTRDAPSIQPLLDEPQLTPGGLPRLRPIPMVMVTGGERTMAALRQARGVGVRRRLWYLSQGVRVENLVVL